MAIKDNSDYNRARTKLYDLVPEVFRSDTNRALFGNLFDRYLSKQESDHAVGYVGKGNPNAVASRQLVEPTLHRQAFQLQPIIRSKVGSVEHMSSWEDLRNEYERLGIDMEQFDEWGKVLQFNWVPPIDIDKLINYDDYYWFTDTNTLLKPEYITMRSRCTTAVANANFWERLVDEYGANFPIAELMLDNVSVLPDFAVISLTAGIDEVVVTGDITSNLQLTQYFNITGTIANDGVYQVSTIPTYNAGTNRSTFTVTAGTIASNETTGTVTLRRFNRLRLSGEYHRLLEEGFVFYVRDTTNTEFGNAFWQSAGAEYDPVLNETIVTISSFVTEDTQGGVISLQENLNFYLAEKSCQCSGGIGWDILLWDDNPDAPVWDGDFATLLTSISNSGPPILPGSGGDLWYDTIDDKFYQYSTTTGWKLLYNNFSLIVDKTEGFALWDYTEDCELVTRVPSAAQWATTNFWLHKTDVPNFAKAKKAIMPILEFDWDLELNEWTVTNYNWKYRVENIVTFETTTAEPSIVELQPVSIWTIAGNTITVDARYGDLTNFFTPGTIFRSVGTLDFYEVDYSNYSRTISTYPYETQIILTAIPSGLFANDPLYPTKTSVGDPWKNYGDHWLFDEPDNAIPTAHQSDNPFILPTLTAAIVSTPPFYDYSIGYGSQEYTVTDTAIVNTFTLDSTLLPGSLTPLTRRAMIGQNDVRVYINDIRQYGNYSETGFIVGSIDYVVGIVFDVGAEPVRFDDVRIEVGEASINEIGKLIVPIRTIEDNILFAAAPVEYTSIIKYRRAEQVKTQLNQYPLFDIYNVDSSPADEVSEIFGYATSPDAPVNLAVRRRTIQDVDNKIFDFDQFLINKDNDILKAWRDYSNKGNDIWYDPISQTLNFFDNLSWSTKTDMGGYYRTAIVSDIEPVGVDAAITGLYWVDTLNNTIVQRSGTNWIPVLNVDTQTSDSTLQSIWRKGLNNEEYIPSKVDWTGRTNDEYNTERDLFVIEKAQELIAADSSLSQSQATLLATTEWLKSQSNTHSISGIWVGDWEVPDPLYYNNLNENRKFLNSRELLTHFTSIVDSQPRIAGYTGRGDAMFHLIPTDEVNYGLGGTIREYNDSYDTAFSSTFVNNVTPITLFEYARDQYESLLNNLEELFRRNAVNYFIDTTQESLVYFTQTIAEKVITSYELNDNASLVYGDSTTFTDVGGVNDLGIRNWIATLPYLKLIYASLPEKLVDPIFNLNQVIHHDGHRRDYKIEEAVIEELITVVINTPDERTRFPGPQDPPIDTFGKTSSNLPPNNMVEFGTTFNTTILNREGVYWHYISTDRILYRLDVAAISDQEPISTLPEGTLWFDISVGAEVLREKVTSETGVVTWDIVFGNTLGDGRLHNGTNTSDLNTASKSAWSIIDLNEIVADIVLESETRLFENVPDTPQLRYDFEGTANSNITLYNTLLEQSFLDFVTQSEIVGQYLNTNYTATDPFTWNYKYSIPGAGFNIVGTDTVANTITIQGDHVAFFDPCTSSAPGYAACPSQTSFFIKNSLANDGNWQTKVSTAGFPVATLVGTGPNQVTVLDVVGTVNSSTTGLLYTGILPSSKNNGSESGGDWRDYYTKLYNTPYPHLEPWKLQGYANQPAWWNAEYANDDVLKWGNRRWKYAHGFDIVDVVDTNGDTILDAFSIDGDFREIFPTGYTFGVDESLSHAGVYTVDSMRDLSNALIIINSVTLGGAGTSAIVFDTNVVIRLPVGMRFALTDSSGNHIRTFTVKTSTFTGPPNNETVVVVEEVISDDAGFSGPIDNATVSGITYDLSTNRSTIRTTAATLASAIEGRITVAIGMWEQVRIGNIKAGERYPNNVLSITGIPGTDVATYNIQDPDMPTFNYFSVNIDNDSISSDGGTTNFLPDEVLPPYWDYVPQFGASVVPFDRAIRSVFFNFSTEINSPSIDYLFGDAGPVEYEWRISSQFLYDQLTISYKIDPIRLVTHTFGIDFVELGDLQIDSRTEKVLSHNRTDFHGEIIDNNVYKVAGTNQWYVNFNRFTGFDISLSDFRAMWVDWTAPLMYQMATFVDTDSLSIDHRTVPLSNSDYAVSAKRSPAVEDYWNDAFDVSVLSIPPKLISHDTQADWKLEIGTHSNRSRQIKYYDVHNYQFGVDTNTNICTLYTWEITSVSTFADSVTVESNQVDTFQVGRTITIDGSTGNDGNYVISSSVYDSFTDRTVVAVDGSMPSSIADGTVTVTYRSLPWITGDAVYLSTTQLLPLPLEGDNINGLFKYFVIIIDSTRFQLALTQQEAFNGTNTLISDTGKGDHFVGQVLGTFTALNGDRTDTLWRRYALDKTNTLSFDTPYFMAGIQNLVNIIHGYDVLNHDDGWRVNDENSEADFDTNRLVSWQVEIERFINTAYSLRTTREAVNDRFAVTVNITTDEWNFTDANTFLITGDAVNILSVGTLPSPLIQGLRYYIIRDTFDTFRLASSKLNAINGMALDITAIGTGDLSILSARTVTYTSPSIEINPMRNGIWFRPTRGIVSDVITGPTEDIRNQESLFDQYNRPLTIDQIRIFREDLRTQISVSPGINDIEIGSDTVNPYNNLHLGGAHIFIDTYEHVTIFNNYTSDGSLVYDPFIGLNLTKMEYDLERQVEFTQRPNMGGFYFETFFNQNASLRRNIEANIEDLRYTYDTYAVQESNSLVSESRKSLGYEGSTEYLDNLNLNDKSQFIFWRGMIQQKGSISAVNAFVNSRRFIDAKVDEFWAYKVADFGSALEQEYPEIFVTTADSKTNDFRVEFLTENNPAPEPNFVGIEGTDEERWYRQPDQVEILRDNGQNLYFELSAHNKLASTDPNVDIIDVGITGHKFVTNGMDNGEWSIIGSPTAEDNLPIFRHNFAASSIVMTIQYYEQGHNTNTLGTGGTTYSTTDQYIVGANSLRVFVDGVEQFVGIDFIEIPIAVDLPLGILIDLTTAAAIGADIRFLFQPGTLLPGIHFDYINSDIIRLVNRELFPANDPIYPNFDFSIWGMNLQESAQNPARLIDKDADTLLATIQVWDPARGDHYYQSLQNIQLQSDNDMAIYSNGTNSTPQIGPWGKEHIGKTWLDTFALDYVPYYDEQAFSNVDDRLRLWGQLASWGSAKIYEWVKSDIPPSEWDAVASVEEGDITIREAIRKSGTARKVLFKNTGTLIAPIWVPHRDTVLFVDLDAAIEGVDNLNGTFQFEVGLYIPVGVVVDVYVNGLLIETTTTTNFMDIIMTINDTVHLHEVVDTSDTAIAADVTLMEDYQYTTVDWVDSLGVTQQDYYFWVENKGTIDRTTSRTLSIKTAEQQLFTIPISYVVMQKVLPEQTIITEPNTLLTREEFTTAFAGQVTYPVALPIAPGTSVRVFVNGTEVLSTNITVGAQSVTLVTPAITGDGVNVEYTGLYDITSTVPIRFVQSIIRGLRGLVQADRRYTIRYTRDFTLRDSLEDGDTSLMLKDAHQEWKIFREQQLFHIDRYLWDKITEAMIGYKLTNSLIRVPSLTRELYDARYLTDTQIGLRNGQKFTDGPLAIQTVLADLQNPDNSFQPIDINVFFDQHSFDTVDNIISAMDTIYTTFPFGHVNRIYFSVLHDAFSFKDKYEDMFKTSMIALHGVRPFQVLGVFDD